MSACCSEYVIEDTHTGDEICTGCSRATQTFFHSAPSTCDYSFSKIEIELKDICANYFILDSIFYRAVDLFRKKGKGSREAAAYSLYKALVNSEVPRTLKEVSTMFNMPASKIAQEESNCVSHTKPSHLAARVLYRFDIIDQPLVDEISAQADRLYVSVLCSATPQTVLAVCIAQRLPLLPKQTIACHCGISKQTLLKHLKRIKQETTLVCSKPNQQAHQLLRKEGKNATQEDANFA